MINQLAAFKIKYNSTPAQLIIDHIDYLSGELNRVNHMLDYISADINRLLNYSTECLTVHTKYSVELCHVAILFRHLSVVLVRLYADSEALANRRYANAFLLTI